MCSLMKLDMEWSRSVFYSYRRALQVRIEEGGELVSAGDPKQLRQGLRSPEEIQVNQCLCAVKQSFF